MLQSHFAEFLQLYSSITLVFSTHSLVSDLIRCADQFNLTFLVNDKTLIEEHISGIPGDFFIDNLRERLKTGSIIFSPEFLREGSSIRDNINPSRIVIGSKGLYAEDFSKILLGCIRNKKDEIIYEAKHSATLGLNLIELEKKLSSAEIKLSNEEKILVELENEK